MDGQDDSVRAEQAGTRSHGQGKVGHTKQTDAAVDRKLAAHTLRGAADKLTALAVTLPMLGTHEIQRAIDELDSDIGLVRRTLEGVQRRGAR